MSLEGRGLRILAWEDLMRSVFGAWAILVLASTRPPPAAGIQPILQIEIATLPVPQSLDWADLRSYRIWGLAFSRDEKSIAIGLGWPFPRKGGGVVVLPLADPARPVYQFATPYAGYYRNLAWSPDGSRIGFDFHHPSSKRATVLQLATGTQCAKEGQFLGFVDSRRWMLRETFGGQEPGGVLLTIDDTCHVVDRWDSGFNFRDFAISPDGKLFALHAFVDPAERALLVLDLAAKMRVWRWATPARSGSNAYDRVLFADDSRLLCGTSPAGKDGATLACWEAATGTKTSETSFTCLVHPADRVRPGESFPDREGEFSAGGSFILMDELLKGRTIGYRPILGFWLDHWYTSKRRVIWDARRDRELAHWTPSLERGYRGGPEWEFPLALSASGAYAADAGPAGVTLYRTVANEVERRYPGAPERSRGRASEERTP